MTSKRKPERTRYCRHCGGVGARDLRLTEHEGRAVTLCGACRERLAKALDGDPEWRWLLRGLSIWIREWGEG